MKLVFYFIVFLYYTNTVSAQDWIGFGKGTSYLIVDGNRAKVNTCNYSFPIRFQEFDLGVQRVEVFDSATGDLYRYLSMEVLGLNMDSVKVFSIDGELLGTFFNC